MLVYTSNLTMDEYTIQAKTPFWRAEGADRMREGPSEGLSALVTLFLRPSLVSPWEWVL